MYVSTFGTYLHSHFLPTHQCVPFRLADLGAGDVAVVINACEATCNGRVEISLRTSYFVFS